MKFELKDYQDDAARKAMAGLRRGSRDYADVDSREFSAVSLDAPTGAGKTVIAAAVIERTWYGDPDSTDVPAPTATFLWLTDDPSLNEQTRKKILESSDRIKPGQLVTIDEGFDQPTFDPGKVYFLNTQKLAKTSNFVRRREGVRKTTLWETMTATIKTRGEHYYVIIDEAHRATKGSNREQQTNAQRIIHGSEGRVPASPVVWGISATPDNFIAGINSGTPHRTLRPVSVPVAAVRESGLLKDVLSIQYRDEDQVMDTTLVAAAVRNIAEMDEAWKAYTDNEAEPEVRPLLVLQIPDEKSYDYDKVGNILDRCVDEWAELAKSGAIRHSLGEHTEVKFGNHAVRHIAPQDIQDHPRVRLVLFKEALTTGWDCPRAETMVSLRTAVDKTYIAQLIGRMVRSPLARRIEADDRLNRVRLYLPHFDSVGVEKVKEKLSDKTSGIGSGSDIEINTIDVPKNGKLPNDVFVACENLPSYLVPGLLHRSQVARLNKLAALLVRDGLLPGAVSNASDYLVGVLNSERERLAAAGTLDSLVADAGTATTAIDDIDLRNGKPLDKQADVIALDTADIDVAFAAAGRVFRDGLAGRYWAHLVAKEDMDPSEAKILVAALSFDTAAHDKVETDAAARVSQWFTTHGAEISKLSEDRRDKYQQVRAMTREPELTPLKLKETRSMPNDAQALAKHLYANAGGLFMVSGGGWETHVLATEVGRDETVAWYRNPTGGSAALRVAYPTGTASGFTPMYPDFIFFTRNDDDSLQPSIVDPHGHHLADAGPKLRGLANYAQAHGKDFGRILGVVKIGDEYYQLNLQDAEARAAVKNVNTKDDIEAVFKNKGALYS